MKSKLKITLTSLTLLLLCASSLVYAASITGTIVYEGKAPKFREIKMDADPICVMHNAEARFPQTLVLGENQTMGNVFIHVVKGLPKKTHETPTEPVVLTQQGCMYEPHVIALMVGQPLKILNPDGTLHNVHALSKINKEFNIAMPKFRKEMSKTFDKEEFMFPIKCDVHPWMGAYASVMTHPYFDITEADGKFSIDQLPPGEYVIEIWHEKLGKQSAKVMLTEEGSDDLSITFSKPKPKNTEE